MPKMPMTRNQTNAAAQAKNITSETAGSSRSKDCGEQDGNSSESDRPRRDSPDNCSICLGPFINKSFTNSCAHSFCFVCLKQWSKVKAECPLCKQPFLRIFHNIRSNQVYDTYELPRQIPNPVNQYNIYDSVGVGLTAVSAPTHHYLSLSQPFDADLTLSNFSRFQFRHRRYDRYLNPLNIQEHPYSFTNHAVNQTTHVSAAGWPRGPEDFRHEVYRHNLGPPAFILGNENSTYRLTPAMVFASSHRLHRIMPWLTREMRVLLRSTPNVRLAVSMIQPLLSQVSIDSDYFHDRVVNLIGRRTRIFIQEFLAFANSALSMQAFDRKAMYMRDESIVASSPNSTSSENDVVEITDVSPDSAVANIAAESQVFSSSQPLDLRRSGWDSPTPGPSWNNLRSRDSAAQVVAIDRVSVSSESDDPVFIPHQRDSVSDDSRTGSDIIFVKYDKPWEERSPINLTSDSEKDHAKKKKKSKHKKKRKRSDGKGCSVRKEKNKKGCKGKSLLREHPKRFSREDSEEEKSGSSHKRHKSLSSPEMSNVKRHKKSKEKRERSSDPDKDRELVDRLFAKAFAQQQKGHSSSANDRSGRLCSKERSKKKKKNKNRSRGSSSASHNHSYKKHHSGHKKSSNTAHISQTKQTDGHHKSSSLDDKGPKPPNCSSHRDSLNIDQESSDHPHSSNSHPETARFQPPYLPIPDTFQHIPVNLWVSTWPALPVSHTYATHSHTSSNLSGHSVSQKPRLSFSSMVSTHNNPGPSSAAQDSHTVTSDSSSDYDSDDHQDNFVPSLKNVDSHTMNWLETHCPDLGRLPTSTPSITDVQNASVSSTSSSSSSALSSSSEICVSQQPLSSQTANMTREKDTEECLMEVVSVGSGEDDIVICSSTNDSDSDEIHCLERIPPPASISAVTSNSKESEPIPSTSKHFKSTRDCSSTIPFLPDCRNDPQVKTNRGSSVIFPSKKKSFQPFELHKNTALTQQGKDPFFPSMSHSSDEDDDIGKSNPCNLQSSCIKETDVSDKISINMTEDSTFSTINPISTSDIVTLNNKLVSSVITSNKEGRQTETVALSEIKGPSDFNNTADQSMNGQLSEIQPSTTFSNVNNQMLDVLSSLPQSTHPLTSVLPSSLNYLSFSSLPPPPSQSPLSCSISPPRLPFGIPSTATQPSSLALHFPFTPLSSILPPPQRNSLLSPIYPSINQHLSNVPSLNGGGENSSGNVTSYFGNNDRSVDETYQQQPLPYVDTIILPENCLISTVTSISSSDNLQNVHKDKSPELNKREDEINVSGIVNGYDMISIMNSSDSSYQTPHDISASEESKPIGSPGKIGVKEPVCSGLSNLHNTPYKSNVHVKPDFLNPDGSPQLEELSSSTGREKEDQTSLPHGISSQQHDGNIHNLLTFNSTVDSIPNFNDNCSNNPQSSHSFDYTSPEKTLNMPFGTSCKKNSVQPLPFEVEDHNRARPSKQDRGALESRPTSSPPVTDAADKDIKAK